jgi:hypothetical protein
MINIPYKGFKYLKLNEVTGLFYFKVMLIESNDIIHISPNDIIKYDVIDDKIFATFNSNNLILECILQK